MLPGRIRTVIQGSPHDCFQFVPAKPIIAWSVINNFSVISIHFQKMSQGIRLENGTKIVYVMNCNNRTLHILLLHLC